MEKEMKQEVEWREAQKTVVNVDLVAAAKQQLQFLATVDRNRWLYQGPGLDRAIYRYNAFWLPLLAKHTEAPLVEGPLVVPLDCEWVWHCHRLNPARYKSDCEEFYGEILDNCNVVSSVQGILKTDTEEVWKKLYPNEPYELDSASVLEDNVAEKASQLERCTKYDLISAVQRQSPFYYQVSRPYMNSDLYLEGAVARYKGFLHLIKTNKERSIKSFSVPTYDIDLIWHTHQLHPASYCNDLVQIMGKVLEHDDTDSDRTKGKKLDVGFTGTTKSWEEMYGSRYWRAGAMNRGSAPSPLRSSPFPFSTLTKKVTGFDEDKKILDLTEVRVMEVMLEFVSVKNLPDGHKGSLFVSFSKTQPDAIFNAKRRLTILSESGEKQVASFQCQPTGDMLFELMIRSPSNNPLTKAVKTLGSGSISLEDLLLPKSGLIMEKWLELMPSSNSKSSKPISLRVAISITLPTSAPYVLNMVRSRSLSKSSCFFPLPGKVKNARNCTRVIDEDGNEAISLQIRDFNKSKGEADSTLRKEVIGVLKSGETCTLADCVGTEWSFRNSQWSIQLQKSTNDDGHLLELTGPHTVRFYPGKRLEYEQKHCEKHRNEKHGNEQYFITAVEFSAEEPYGKAVALLDLNSGFVQVKESWLLLPGTVLAFILADLLRKDEYDNLVSAEKNVKENENSIEEVNGEHEVSMKIQTTSAVEKGVESDINVAEGNMVMATKGGGSGGGCENSVTSGGCGGCGASGCGSMVTSGGCGGCGGSGGCGSMVTSGGCGGSGGCGSMVKGGGCGGCGGSGGCGGGNCGSMVKSGGCGGCGGCGGSGGCGSMVKSGGCGGCGGRGYDNKVASETNASAISVGKVE